MWLTAVIALLVAVLSGMGVGSAGLLVLWLVTAEQLPQLTAQGLNLVFFLCSSGAALSVHLLRTPILWGCVLCMLPMGFLGCFFGTRLALLLPDAILRRGFGILLAASGALGLLRKEKKE